MSARERAVTSKSLICLLQGTVGYRTTVELRNENAVTGVVKFVDGHMNMSLEDARFKTLDGKETRFEQFYVSGVQIRFVHIPDCLNMMKTIERQLQLIEGVRNKKKFEKRRKNKKMSEKAQEKFNKMREQLALDEQFQ